MFDFFNDECMMITCKMVCVIKGIMLPHHFQNVNLNNYGLPHIFKSVTSHVFSPPLTMMNMVVDYQSKN